jgi:hypothetical protein
MNQGTDSPSSTSGTDFVLCINNDDYPIDLTVHKVYRVIVDEKAEQHGWIRVVDNTDEDYLYPSTMFLPLELSEQAQQTFVAHAAHA